MVSRLVLRRKVLTVRAAIASVGSTHRPRALEEASPEDYRCRRSSISRLATEFRAFQKRQLGRDLSEAQAVDPQ
jgi:hypothetical protein